MLGTRTVLLDGDNVFCYRGLLDQDWVEEGVCVLETDAFVVRGVNIG